MRNLKKLVFPLMLAMVMSLTATAEDAPTAPTGFSVLTVEVKAGSQQTFEAFIAKYKEAVEKVGGPAWFAESPGIGSLTTYSFARPFNSYADLADQSNPLVEAFGADEAQKVAALFGDSVASSSTATYLPRPDLSIQNDGEGAEVVLAFDISVNPGMEEKFENWVKKLIAATDDRQFNTYQRGVGEGPDYSVRVPMKWADLDVQPTPIPEVLEKKYGKKEMRRLMADNLAAVSSIVESVTRVRADMSNIPAN